jgi:hypothetical protein
MSDRMKRISMAALSLIVLARTASAQSYTISPSPFLTALDNSGLIINGACIWTYVAGSSTLVSTYSDNIGTTNSNPIRSDSAGRFTAFLVPGSIYKFVYESSCVPPAHGTTLRTADNIAAMPASSATVDVQGTAGEAITAGQCVYLSDGSGGKTVGQWFKCDSTNTYSSVTAEVGLAPSAITSGSAGTVRLAGAVTGLSSLSVGSEYFAGAAGAVTSTAPTNRRHLGHADSATSLVLTADPQSPFGAGTVGQIVGVTSTNAIGAFVSTGLFNDFRLSLTTATCVTTSDVTAAVTLFLTPCWGNRITLLNSSGLPETCTTAEISIAVPATTSTMYDVWAYDSSFGTCAVTLELLAWTNDTTRATAIARSGGRWTKSGDTTRMYLGSFRTTTVAGQTEDSAAKRHVWNYYNRVRRSLIRKETTATWNYTTATIRQANNAAANQVDVVVGVAEVLVSLIVEANAANDTAGMFIATGIGFDVTNAFTGGAGQTQTIVSINTPWHLHAPLTHYPTVGRHFYAWLEWSSATGITTWAGTNPAGGPAGVSLGLTGFIEG